MSEHTPGPWKCEATIVWAPEAQKVICEASELRPKSGLVQYEKVTPGSPALKEVFANAEFIVRACNAHNGLVEACEAIVWAHEHDEDSLHVMIDAAQEVLAAIAKPPR